MAEETDNRPKTKKTFPPEKLQKKEKRGKGGHDIKKHIVLGTTDIFKMTELKPEKYEENENIIGKM